MAEVKMTKAMWFEEIKAVVEGCEHEQKAEMLEFIDKQLEYLDGKKKAAAERAAKKRAEGDALRDAVEQVLTDELQSIDQITAQIEGEDVTKAKVTARLTQLVKAELAQKDMIKEESGRKVTAYKLA